MAQNSDRDAARIESEHRVATAFAHGLHDFIVLIAARDAYCDTSPKPVGTGWILGRIRHSDGRERVVIGTAGHVIDHDQAHQTEWTIVRRRTPSREELVSIATSGPDEGSSAVADWYAGNFYVRGDDRRLQPSLDLGTLDLPNVSNAGPLLGPSERTPTLVPTNGFLVPGTRVAWAGYSMHAQRLLGRPFLCYHEGVVSTTVLQDDLPPLYLIDGHVDSGLSGSPVWCWSDEAQQAQVAAVITHYSAAESPFPGLVHASPVNVLTARLDQRAKGKVQRQ